MVTRAELALVEGNRDAMLEDYAEATALAVTDKNHFALDSSRQTIELFRKLGFRADLVVEAAEMLDRGEQQLNALLRLQPEAPTPGTRTAGPLPGGKDGPSTATTATAIIARRHSWRSLVGARLRAHDTARARRANIQNPSRRCEWRRSVDRLLLRSWLTLGRWLTLLENPLVIPASRQRVA